MLPCVLLFSGLAEEFVDSPSKVMAGALIGTGSVLLASFALYWWIPTWRSRGGRLIEVPSELMPELLELTNRAGIRRTPRFVLDSLAMTAGAVVFGRAAQYTVCLHAGLLFRREQDPKAFEAVILHELAHIRNHDVQIAYAGLAICRVSTFVFVPCVGYGEWLMGLDQAATTTVKFWLYGLLFLAQPYLMYTELLRKRELYADFDAAGWGADPAVWEAEASTPAPNQTMAGRLGNVLRARAREVIGIWHTHPTWEQRCAAVACHRRSAPVGMFGDDMMTLFLLITSFLTTLISLIMIFTMQGCGWVSWAQTLIIYPAALVMAVASSSTPSKNFVIHRYRPVRSGTRRDRALKRAAVFMACTCVLVLWDPLGLRDSCTTTDDSAPRPITHEAQRIVS
jgi:Zn-dependent protease with chaperone function